MLIILLSISAFCKWGSGSFQWLEWCYCGSELWFDHYLWFGQTPACGLQKSLWPRNWHLDGKFPLMSMWIPEMCVVCVWKRIPPQTIFFGTAPFLGIYVVMKNPKLCWLPVWVGMITVPTVLNLSQMDFIRDHAARAVGTHFSCLGLAVAASAAVLGGERWATLLLRQWQPIFIWLYFVALWFFMWMQFLVLSVSIWLHFLYLWIIK